MQKRTKIAVGSAATLAILVAGGLAIALPAQAENAAKSTSIVEPTDPTDTVAVQNEVEDGTDDGETADDAAVEDGTDDGETANDAGVEDDTNDGETADDAAGEDTSDDTAGMAVEDGTQD